MPFPNCPINSGHLTHNLAWGDLYWFDFGKPQSNQYTIAKARPCVVLSDVNTLIGNTVVVCPSTGAEHAIPNYDYHVLVTRNEFILLEKDSVFKVDHLYSVDRNSLIDEHYIGALPLKIMKRLYYQLFNAINSQRVI